MNFPPQVLKYFKDHAISNNVLNEWQIGWNGAQIAIPIFGKDGEIIYHKYRRNPSVAVGSKYLFEKGGYLWLYGVNKIKDEPAVVITEGETCALTLWSQGVPAVSSTGGAMSFREEWAHFFENKEVYIAFDNDFAGARGAVRTLSILPEAKVILLSNLFGVKDVSDWCGRGLDFRRLIEEAKQYKNPDEVQTDMGEKRMAGEPIFFHEIWLEQYAEKEEEAKWDNKKNEVVIKEGADDIARAKSVPIDSIIKVPRSRMIKCLWHNEKSGSMHIYPNNHVYCFGCSKGGDVIDVVMAVKEMTFKEAVKFLNT